MTPLRPSTQLHLEGGTAGQALIVDPTGQFWQPGSVIANVGRDSLTAAGGETALTLGAFPVVNSPLLWKNGTLLWPGVEYTISGTVITFATPLTAGDVIRDYYLTLGTPTSSTLSVTSTTGPQAYALSIYGAAVYG